ncbi:hypothetical protein [Bradyrhizobium sp.]
MDGLIRVATLLVVLPVSSSVEARPLNLRGTTLDWKAADAAQASVSNLCFVETGRGKAKQRTPYILDFGGECPATDSAAYHKKNLRYNMSK